MSRNARSLAFVAVALVCLECLLGGSRRADASSGSHLEIREVSFVWRDNQPMLLVNVANVGTTDLAPSAIFILANADQQEVARHTPVAVTISSGGQAQIPFPMNIPSDPQQYSVLLCVHDSDSGAAASFGPSLVTLPELSLIAPLVSMAPVDSASIDATGVVSSGASAPGSADATVARNATIDPSPHAVERPDSARRHDTAQTPAAGSWIGVFGFVVAVPLVIAIATWLSSRHTAKMSLISPAPPRIAVVPMETRAPEFVHASPSQQLLNLVEQKCRDIEYQSLASIDTQPLNQARPTTQPCRSTGRSTHRHQPTKPQTTGEMKMLWSRGMSVS